MKNAFHFEISFHSHVEKRLDYKDKVKLKIYDITTQLTNNYNRMPIFIGAHVRMPIFIGVHDFGYAYVNT